MRAPFQLSFMGDGRVLRVTPETARELFFDAFTLRPREKLDLELPTDRWRSCGKGLIDHLHRRCHHEDLSAEELSWLERGLNLLLAKRKYQFFKEDGRIEHVSGAPKQKGLYTQRCGALFLLAPLPKEHLAVERDLLIVREDDMRELHFSSFSRVATHQGRIWLRMTHFFSGLDLSLPLEAFQHSTRRVFRVLKISPSERGDFKTRLALPR